MKKSFLFVFFLGLFMINSCSKEESKVVIKDETVITPEDGVDIFGQWNFINEDSKKEPINYAKEFCNINSIIFEEFESNSNSTFDGTYKLYTSDEEGLSNYVIFGFFTLSDSILSLFVVEGNYPDYNFILIGTVDGLSSSQELLSGDFDIQNICVDLKDGFQEAKYTKGLTYVPDVNLENWLVNEGYDDRVDGYMTTSRAYSQGIIAIKAQDNGYVNGEFCNCEGDDRWSNRLNSLAGIEAFSNIRILNLTGHSIDSINISKNGELEYLYLDFNTLKKLDTSNNFKLKELSMDNNQGETDFNFSNNSELEKLSLPNTGIASIDLSNNNKLEFLDLYLNNITIIDLSPLLNLKELRLGKNKLNTINFSNNNLLEIIRVNDNELEGVLDVSMCPNLRVLIISQNNLTELIVSQAQYDNLTKEIIPEGFEWVMDSSVIIKIAGDQNSEGSSGRN